MMLAESSGLFCFELTHNHTDDAATVPHLSDSGGPVASLKAFSGIGVKPPVEPMLAKLGDELPSGGYLYEPKWDGFRAIVFRGEDAGVQRLCRRLFGLAVRFRRGR
jgi:ATP-dependent DNA ligase